MPMGLQEWIHKLEEGEGAIWIKRAFWVIAFAALAAIYNVREFKNFNNPEAMDSAQVARNISEGRGFTTKFIRPLSVKLIQAKKGDAYPDLINHHPDLAHAPVYPLLQAGLMKAAPFKFSIEEGANFWRYQPEVWIAIFNQILFGLLLWSIFILGRRLFDASVGATTAAVTGLTELFWRFSVSGLPTLFLTLVTVWIIWFLAVMEQRSREGTATNQWFYGMAAAIGALLAVGTLTRYSYGWMAIPIIGFAAVCFVNRRGGSIAAILIILLVALAPWCYRNYELSGKPFGIAQFAAVEGTTYFPRTKLQRSMPQNLAFEMNKVTVDQFIKKMLTGMDDSLRNELPKLGGSWASALFLVGLLAPFRNPGLSRLRFFIIGSLILLMIVQSLGKTAISELSPEINSENLLILVSPVVFMFGIALFFTLIEQVPFEFPHYRTAAIGGFVVVASLPLLMTFLPPRSFPFAFPPYYPPYIKDVSEWMKEDELVMSDMPWAVAWYGNRKCVWTTLDAGLSSPSDFFAIHDYITPVKLLYLTPITLDTKFVSELLKGTEGAWSRFALEGMVRTNVPAGFPLRHSPRGYLPDFLILTDRKRW